MSDPEVRELHGDERAAAMLHYFEPSKRVFEARRRNFPKAMTTRFSEVDAPDWLTSADTVPGSTMDNRWFWTDHVLTLQVGQSIGTDWHVVTRVA